MIAGCVDHPARQTSASANVKAVGELLGIGAERPQPVHERRDPVALFHPQFGRSGDTQLPAGGYDVSINWGDDSADDHDGVVEEGDPGEYTIAGSHAYVEPGSYSIVVSITQNGVTTVVRSTALVQPAPTTLTPVNLQLAAGHALNNVIVAQLTTTGLTTTGLQGIGRPH